MLPLGSIFFQMRRALDEFYVKQKRFPDDLQELVPRYLRKVPVDPATGASDTWILIRDGVVIIDVKSGATGVTCDGIQYGDL